MARSRRLSRQAPLFLLVCGSLTAAVLTQVVSLSNRVVAVRGAIAELRAEKAYLEAAIGLLDAEWNRIAGAEVIVPRAEKELGLVTPDGPGLVVVMLDGAKERDWPAGRRLLDAVGGGGQGVATAVAAERMP